MKKSFFICPICKEHRFSQSGDGDICPHCGWQNVDVMNKDEHYSGGANDLSKAQFRLRYEYYISKNSKYHWAHDFFPEIPQVEEMDCPVCGEYRFQKLTIEDIYCGKTPQDLYCRICGWRYDLEQITHPTVKCKNNLLSLTEYRKWYKDKIELEPEYCYFNEETDSYVPTPHKCPVCGKYQFEDEGSFDVCKYCGWEDDAVQLFDSYYEGGANKLCLVDYQKAYKLALKQDPNYVWDKNPRILADIISSLAKK